MKIGVFCIATSVYTQYFDRYFFKTMHNLFPEDEKEVIILTDNIHEEYASCNIKNCNIHFEKIIDFPYPILNLCKFQIIDEYAKKYNIDIVLFFDADTIIFNKDIEFWNMLKQKCLDNQHTLIMSKHPYCITHYVNYATDYFFPYREGSVSNITEEQLNTIGKESAYIIASFFMGYKNAITEYANKIHVISHNNLVKLQWVPRFPEEYYINVINLRENMSIDLGHYITINDGKGKSIWFNDTNDPNVFLNQKFDVSIKNKKKNQI